jgi:hypothetical protein
LCLNSREAAAEAALTMRRKSLSPLRGFHSISRHAPGLTPHCTTHRCSESSSTSTALLSTSTSTGKGKGRPDCPTRARTRTQSAGRYAGSITRVSASRRSPFGLVWYSEGLTPRTILDRRSATFNRVISAIVACLLFLSGLAGCSRDTQPDADVPNVSAVDSAEDPENDAAAIPNDASTTTSVESPSLVNVTEPDSASAISQPMPEYRLPVTHLELDDATLARNGIRRYESKHLLLLTDLAPKDVTGIPELAGAFFDELQRRTGTLAPAADGSDYQVIGCLINAVERFENAGLMPPKGFTLRHGRHLGNRFWMFNPTTDYYRRHLLLHEFTHCFMMCEHGMSDIPPLWYTEGIAEYFATHSLMPGNSSTLPVATFGILPDSVTEQDGWGRISEIKRNFEQQPATSAEPSNIIPLFDVLYPDSASFLDDSQYANAWALVWLICTNPDYRGYAESLLTARKGELFKQRFTDIPEEVISQLQTDWLLVIDSICEGFDIERSFPTRSISTDGNTLKLRADRGWQFTGITVSPGDTLDLNCEGLFQVHDEPRPWMSEPQGITIEYHRGRPLGEIVALLVSTGSQTASRRIPIGRAASVTSPVEAELWLQINDSAASRSDNSGFAEVTIQHKTR